MEEQFEVESRLEAAEERSGGSHPHWLITAIAVRAWWDLLR